jgi:6-phosphogluconolactonase (cycloisomerase 2 family)
MASYVLATFVFCCFRLCGARTFSDYIYVASNNGLVYTLHFWEDGLQFSLSEVTRDDNCGLHPTWLMLGSSDTLWCLNEGSLSAQASVTRFDMSLDGNLAYAQRINISAGPVQSVEIDYGRSLAIACYGGELPMQGGVTTLVKSTNGSIERGKFLALPPLDTPGPKPAQKIARAHGTALDPSGRFLVVPDLGADMVRVFSVENGTGSIKFENQVKMLAGCGPRHAAFWQHPNATSSSNPAYLYVVSEFASTVTVFKAVYTATSFALEYTGQTLSTLGNYSNSTGTAAAAEIAISPDKRFVVVSNRNDTSFDSPPSDSLAVFRICPNDGSLEFWQLARASGRWPRHFDISTAGDRVVVALQRDSKIAILARNNDNGSIGDLIATMDLDTADADGKDAGVNAAIWMRKPQA